MHVKCIDRKPRFTFKSEESNQKHRKTKVITRHQTGTADQREAQLLAGNLVAELLLDRHVALPVPCPTLGRLCAVAVVSYDLLKSPMTWPVDER